ncbi:putative armadillo-like helical, Ataxin-10 domain-containing protein [Plasmopara halstedii]
MNFETLATECRSAAFRESLGISPVWTEAAETIKELMHELQDQIKAAVPKTNCKVNMQDAESIDEDDDGLNYTFYVDSKDPTAEELHHELLPSNPIVEDSKRMTSQVKDLTAVFRFLRNACAACTNNQNACLNVGVLKQAHEVVMHCCHWVDVEDETLKTEIILLAQVVLQFCVNGVAKNVKNQEVIWMLFFPDKFQKILVECHRHRKVIAFTVALMLNCFNLDSSVATEIERIVARRVDLVCARNLLITILHRCIQGPFKSSESSVSVISVPHIDDQDPAFDWICMLFGVLFNDGRTKHLYTAVGAHILSQLWSRVTPEQLILLRMFRMWAISTLNSTCIKQQQPPPGIFEFVKSTWLYIVTEGDEDRPIEGDEVRKKVWIGLENDAKLMLLDVFGELTVDYAKISPDGATDLLQSLVKELHRVWKRERTEDRRHIGSTLQSSNDEPWGYRSALIRVIGNLCYRQKEHQDFIRENGYLSLFLNHCNVDETNPMIREWSLVALRNLCEQNVDNQKFIEALRPQGIDEDSNVALEKANMHADIGEDGKVLLSKNDR